MKTGEELLSDLAVFPTYDASIRQANETERLIALTNLYAIYVPSQMSIDIYSKLYLALMRSLQKKQTNIATAQQYENYKMMKGQSYTGVIGGSDSMTIIGLSGIGKSSAISRALSLITKNRIIETEKPFARIVPCLVIQCPFDCSAKSLLLDILKQIDVILESNYYEYAIKTRASTDVLIGTVSQVCLNNVGLIVIDEVQNLVNHKGGNSLVAMLTQLINNSGVSVCFVGVPEVENFFQRTLYLARRSIGLHYDTMTFDDEFCMFCKIIFDYQYCKQKTEITDAIYLWLYDHSGGVISIVVSLIYSAQEISILNGTEILNIDNLNLAYKQRLEMLHGYINPPKNAKSQTSKIVKKGREKTGKVASANRGSKSTNLTISNMVSMSKRDNKDVVAIMREHFTVEEVTI